MVPRSKPEETPMTEQAIEPPLICSRVSDEQRMNILPYGLREWAAEHPEASEIFAAID